MSYQALYRVWRPQKFSELVGQELIARTLKNALMTQQTTHAYLFTGPRGTGKTSAAKIFAKALNCHHQENGEPCNKCDICKAITTGRLNDVIEIDAASNNGVEEIRDIRDKVKYAPTDSDYKVYIIDEVHMLSTGAFNALLKTLEEPPENVVFILATTEPHKIPATIISRTQRFDFKRITAQNILQRMEYILQQKDISYEENALKVISKAAEGGMRDALSILDQVISFGDNGEVTVDNALLVTGSVTQKKLTLYFSQILKQDTAGALETLYAILEEGKDAKRLVEDLINYCRDLLLYQQDPKIIEQNEIELFSDSEFKDFASQISPQTLYQMIDLLNEQQENMRFTSHESIYLEVLTVKLTQVKQKNLNISQEQVSGDHAVIKQLVNQVKELQGQIEKLKQQPNVIQSGNSKKANTKQVGTKSSGKNDKLKINLEQIYTLLNNATRQNLLQLKEAWGDLLNMLNPAQRAMLRSFKPAAASAAGIILVSDFPFICQRAQMDTELKEAVENGLSRLIATAPELIFVPEEKWQKIRQEFYQQRQGEDKTSEQQEIVEQPVIAKDNVTVPLVEEAKKIFGAENIEIKED
ncbi:DNA polymerase III subunit gamma/tau [Ligilactobacillus sp. WILCCON 0076]|uniref:DNA-directed DNA polymerase n=1 Tax=Ligilactobacillus ubinensis TaxID=2876789 RepID=A0A9X2FJB3_9LACO|nr:DNA polymerase III subunit gamma/tau [Ligilactobacillus ubinensis]MCP0886389.1 DNA polymerase III subunit gamma/tau [Ligilactobacillus ubinensis]